MRSSLHCCGKISDQSGYTGLEKESECPLYPGYHSWGLDRFREAFDPYHLPSLRVHNNTVVCFLLVIGYPSNAVNNSCSDTAT